MLVSLITLWSTQACFHLSQDFYVCSIAQLVRLILDSVALQCRTLVARMHGFTKLLTVWSRAIRLIADSQRSLAFVPRCLSSPWQGHELTELFTFLTSQYATSKDQS